MFSGLYVLLCGAPGRMWNLTDLNELNSFTRTFNVKACSRVISSTLRIVLCVIGSEQYELLLLLQSLPHLLPSPPLSLHLSNEDILRLISPWAVVLVIIMTLAYLSNLILS